MSADAPSELDRIRQATWDVDLTILRALNQRAQLSLDLQRWQEPMVEAAGVDVGEQAWLKQLTEASEGPLSLESLRAIFSAIRAEARALERPLRAAYVGPEGGFGHQAARGYFGTGAQLERCATVRSALELVVRKKVAFAVFPFESSAAGLVEAGITALAEADLSLVGERWVDVQYALMGADVGRASYERVYATPRAHAACERFLEHELASAVVAGARSPKAAAQSAKADPGSLALVPESCGRELELLTWRAGVDDLPSARLRYVVAGQRPAMRTGADTTCIMLGLDDTPGALHGLLRHFADRGLNIKSSHSRLVLPDGRETVFYAEVAGHVSDRAVVTALEAVRRGTKWLKVLGSFPSAQ